MGGNVAGVEAVVEVAEVEELELVAEDALVVVLVALPIAPDDGVTETLEEFAKVAPDEAASTRDEDLAMVNSRTLWMQGSGKGGVKAAAAGNGTSGSFSNLP